MHGVVDDKFTGRSDWAVKPVGLSIKSPPAVRGMGQGPERYRVALELLERNSQLDFVNVIDEINTQTLYWQHDKDTLRLLLEGEAHG